MTKLTDYDVLLGNAIKTRFPWVKYVRADKVNWIKSGSFIYCFKDEPYLFYNDTWVTEDIRDTGGTDDLEDVDYIAYELGLIEYVGTRDYKTWVLDLTGNEVKRLDN